MTMYRNITQLVHNVATLAATSFACFPQEDYRTVISGNEYERAAKQYADKVGEGGEGVQNDVVVVEDWANAGARSCKVKSY